jgi:hypothetical protein
MNTKDLVQFDWKIADSQEEPIFITIDSNSSVVPDAAGGLPGIFDCGKCTKKDFKLILQLIINRFYTFVKISTIEKKKKQ